MSEEVSREEIGVVGVTPDGQVVATTMTMTIRVSEVDEFRLLIWELHQLASDMRIGASPFAPRLEGALERFMNGTDAVGG